MACCVPAISACTPAILPDPCSGSRTDRADIYQTVTDAIIAALQAGTRPWMKPWNAEHAAGRITRPLRANGHPYRGINVVMLWMAAEAKGYSAPIWMTYKQAAELGGHVRRGEKACPVTYADKIKRKEENEAGEQEEREVFFLKQCLVFNIEQIDGLPAHFYTMKSAAPLDPMQRNAEAEAFFRNTGATIRHGGNMAAYSAQLDAIRMFVRVNFKIYSQPGQTVSMPIEAS
jgi:antirestriction protein ArdC